jgi:hypothetical protein
MTDLSKKTCLVYDRGLYVFAAQRLGQAFKKVYYYMPDAATYPTSDKDDIGTGLPEIERIYNFWQYLDKADLIFFPDCYDWEFQEYLRSKGYRVFGAGRSEELEMNKAKFYKLLKKLSMPVSPYTIITGVDNAIKYLEDKTNKWLKPAVSYYRGDFETTHYANKYQSESWFLDLKTRLGKRCDKLEIIIQDPIDAVCEVGYDGFCVDGNYPKNCMCGYEVKDKGYIGKIFAETPKIVKEVNFKMSPVFKKLGYRGNYSTELRITKDGKAFFTDPTCRLPSPPSELMLKMYTNYPEAVFRIAEGKDPQLQFADTYGAAIMLMSDWNEKHELCVEFPQPLSDYIALKNQFKVGDRYYIVPNNNSGFFGAVVATGKSIKEATNKCVTVIKEIKAQGLEIDSSIFDECQKQIDSGKQFGVMM